MSPSDTPSSGPGGTGPDTGADKAPRRGRGRSLLAGSHRWSRRVASGLILLVAAILVGASLLWTVGGTMVADRLTRFINAHVLAENTTLGIEDVGGTLLHRVAVTGVRIRRQGPEDWFPFGTADRVQVTYDLWGALHGRYAASRVEADGLRLELRTFGDGPILLPQGKGGGSDDGGGGGLPRMWIRKLILRNASLRLDLPFRVLELDSVYAEASVASGRTGFQIQVDTLSAKVGDGLGRLVLAGGRLVAADSVRLEGVSGRWEGSPLSVDGTVGGAPVDLDLSIAEFPLERLGRFLNEAGLDTGYVHAVAGNITTRTGDVTFDWKGAGRWETWDVQDLAGRGRVAGDVLRLTEVTGTTEGAVLSGATIVVPLHAPWVTVEGTFENLHTNTLRVEAVADYPGIVNGSGKVRIEERKDLLSNVTAELRLGAGQFLEVPFTDAWISARIQNRIWSLDSVHVNLTAARIRGSGTFGPDSLDLAFGYLGDLRPWRRFLHREELEGQGRLQVRLLGSTEQPVIRMRGGMGRLFVADIRAPEIELGEAEGVLGEERNLSITFSAPEGLSLGGTPFSRADGHIVVTADRLLMDGLHLERGDTSATVEGNLRWEPVIQVHVDAADLNVNERAYQLDSPADFTFDEDVLSTPGVLIHTPQHGRVGIQGNWNTRTNAFTADVTVENLDPSVFFPPGDLPAVAVGSVDGSFNLHGDPAAINGSTRLGLREVDWEGGHIDSVTAVLTVEGRSLNLEQVDATVAGGRILVAGDVVLPQPLVETVRSVRDSVALDGAATGLDLTATATGVNLPKWRFLLPNRERMAGTVDAVVRLQGTAASPRMEVDGTSGDLVWKHFDAKRITFRGGFADGIVRVDTLETWQQDRKLDVSGTFPLDLALLPFDFAVPDRAMDIRVRSDEGSLSSLRLTPWIRSATGKLEAEARFTGTPRSPRITGYATVEDGDVVLRERDEVLADVAARIRFDGDLIHVEEARARTTLPWNPESGRNSLVTAEGTYRLGAEEEQTYALDIHFKDALAGEEGVYAARVTGDVSLTPQRAADGKIYPFAKGTVFVSRAEYAGSLEPQDIGEFKPPSMLYDVVLNAPQKILIRTEGVDAELGGENLTVRQTPERQEIVGELEILRGTYEFFQKTFRVTRGTLVWDDPTTRLPTMDITAETTEAGYVIRVELTGRVGKPQVQFLALRNGIDAGLTDQEIITMLGVGATGLGALGVSSGVEPTGTNGNQSGGEEALKTVGNLFFNQLERELSRQIGIVDAVELKTESDQGDYSGPIVGVTKYVTPDVSIQYEQGLSNAKRQGLEVEYRLGRILFLRGSVIRLPESGGQDQEYNLDLKIRKDY